MTTLSAFHSVEGSGVVSAIYLVSDSQISSPKAPNYNYSYAQKIFNFKHSPDIIGYSGNSLFGSNSLSKLTSIVDNLNIFKNLNDSEFKINYITKFLNEEFKLFPPVLYSDSNEFMYISRNDKFCVYHIFLKNKLFHFNKIKLKEKSGILFSCGRGAKLFEEMYKLKVKLNHGNETSRVVFWSFLNHLESKKDLYTGGPPQLMLIGKSSISKAVIIYINDKFFLQGNIIQHHDIINDKMEIRNQFFEFVDKKGKPRSNAQRYFLK